MRPRPGLAALALIGAFAATGLVQAQQPAPAVNAPAAEEPVPQPPSHPIPYTQLNKVTAAPAPAAPAEPPKPTGPLPRARTNTAILQALDKVTTETMRFEAPVGKAVRYKDLVFIVRACETAAPDELAPEAAAYVVVNSQPLPQPGREPVRARQMFKGWMFASTPSIDAMEHPVYDAWLVACKTTGPSPANR